MLVLLSEIQSGCSQATATTVCLTLQCHLPPPSPLWNRHGNSHNARPRLCCPYDHSAMASSRLLATMPMTSWSHRRRVCILGSGYPASGKGLNAPLHSILLADFTISTLNHSYGLSHSRTVTTGNGRCSGTCRSNLDAWTVASDRVRGRIEPAAVSLAEILL